MTTRRMEAREQEGRERLRDAREVVAGLRALRERAPERLRDEVRRRLPSTDRWSELPGPIGTIYVAFGTGGISMVDRSGDPAAFEERFLRRYGRPVRRVERAPASIARAVAAAIDGRARPSELPLDLERLPSFEREVLRKTLEIPWGEVRPYGWVAAELGRPRAVRAVGNAIAKNPIPFVIPCHRVVRSDGRIGEYGAGGPDSKRAVLRTEGLDLDELEGLPRRGIRFVGSDTTGIYCYPSCRHARRITPRHRVLLHDAEEARAGGFRACRVCRPVDVAAPAA